MRVDVSMHADGPLPTKGKGIALLDLRQGRSRLPACLFAPLGADAPVLDGDLRPDRVDGVELGRGPGDALQARHRASVRQTQPGKRVRRCGAAAWGHDFTHV